MERYTPHIDSSPPLPEEGMGMANSITGEDIEGVANWEPSTEHLITKLTIRRLGALPVDVLENAGGNPRSQEDWHAYFKSKINLPIHKFEAIYPGDNLLLI